MSRIQNPAPDATRRRASTNRKMETIMRLARRLPLTRQVLADQLETATPSQMEFMDQWMNAEIESRERSKRSRLLKQAGFPAVKTLDGYDWENIRFPVDWGRRSLESLEFASRPEDVVMFGPPGTGKTHLAMALGRKACLEGMTVRFFTVCFVKLGSAFCAVFFRSVGSGFSAGCAVSAAACLRCVVVVLLVYLVMRACSLR